MVRAASIKDVANQAGVAVGTVSNVLNYPDRVSSTTRDRVLAAIAELGFVRNDAARQLRAGRSRTMGMIVLDAGNPFFSSVARAAEEAAARAGSAVLLGNSSHDPRRERHYIELFEEQRMQGILISPTGDVSARLAAAEAAGLKIVLVDAPSDGQRFSSVAVDNAAGGYVAVRHLLDAGRRRIAFVGGNATLRQVQDRLAGARRAVAEVPGATLEVLTAADLTVLGGRGVGDDLRRRTPGTAPDALFCANDLLALGVIQSLAMLGGLRIPEDIALIGYDDIDFAASAVVPLSSIRQPAELIGRTAVELLLEQTADEPPAPRSVVFTPELVARASTGH
ncbi:LacI family DNA-binding transcriptional regulator [Arthrobacter sp. 35W]|uniref:LacI family DNA-binding transcriptional regulator n=1 Tax=Arthrobacter sp. 35W TaxID=1132441 RepID=UPI00040474A3|nr:LacI family DNA-binding transcriptional regulator [Arthrobacter sp. 35W]